MAVNKEKIITLVAEIEKAKRQLEEYVALGEPAILGSSERLNSLKYLFVVAIEACVDICQHFSAKLFSEVPESYSKCFEILSKRGVITESLAEQMGDLARFRNLLIHRYWGVDDKRVVQHLKRIETFDRFVRDVAAYIGITSAETTKRADR